MITTMMSLRLAFISLWTVTSVQASQYGHNYLTVEKDSAIVAKAFQDVEGINLIAPAFNSDTVPVEFSNGTSGPTSDDVLGEDTTQDSALDKH
jgi:hypothetical protein